MPQYCAVVSGTAANVFATLVICVHLLSGFINPHRTLFCDRPKGRAKAGFPPQYCDYIQYLKKATMAAWEG